MTNPFAASPPTGSHIAPTDAQLREQLIAVIAPVKDPLERPRPQRVALQEILAAAEQARIDRTAGVIRSVKVLGLISRNGRHYTAEAVARAASLYEGAPVNVNHPPRDRQSGNRQNGERAVVDRFGVLRNVRCLPEGLYGDLYYLRHHPLAEMILEAAERMPSAVGLSHNADGMEVIRNGRRTIQAITQVRSVDLVSDPASTSGLFESHQPGAGQIVQPGAASAPQGSLPMLLGVLRRGPHG